MEPAEPSLDVPARQRCYGCFRPQSLCFCDQIPRVDNRTDVLILQHVGERFHPFNTARIVSKSLNRCELIIDHNRRFSQYDLPLKPGAGLLYPQSGAPTLAELRPNERPSQLVLLDGTWHQAKTIYRDVPQLQELPCFRLQPDQPGNYRIRREPNEFSLSTLETTVAALQANEPQTHGLLQLLNVFTQMVDAQLAHPASRNAWRRKKSRGTRPRNIPPALLGLETNLVVAYGESLPRELRPPSQPPRPVNWVAERLGTADRFACCVATPDLPEAILHHLRLTPRDLAGAIGHDEFVVRWNKFLRPDDVLVVYHDRTLQLVKHGSSRPPRCLVLKSIFGRWASGFRSVEDLMEQEGVVVTADETRSRAQQRLAATIALVRHLRTKQTQQLEG